MQVENGRSRTIRKILRPHMEDVASWGSENLGLDLANFYEQRNIYVGNKLNICIRELNEYTDKYYIRKDEL